MKYNTKKQLIVLTIQVVHFVLAIIIAAVFWLIVLFGNCRTEWFAILGTLFSIVASALYAFTVATIHDILTDYC